ncbi:hypothetical protein BV22DRAFT_813116 [Leucogyrophana mollusca]|uniref:Uncharacterized protein n=1 Tax=Leucogyrophana mollusca TaxID=85980 RepID=A0ACB8B5C2_9AGAM|nr:hypothetical protein BV22DRAFT_813116 [Leucogyrophana mollusca]
MQGCTRRARSQSSCALRPSLLCWIPCHLVAPRPSCPPSKEPANQPATTHAIRPARTYLAQFMTSLNAPGFSLSLVNVLRVEEAVNQGNSPLAYQPLLLYHVPPFITPPVYHFRLYLSLYPVNNAPSPAYRAPLSITPSSITSRLSRLPCAPLPGVLPPHAVLVYHAPLRLSFSPSPIKPSVYQTPRLPTSLLSCPPPPLYRSPSPSIALPHLVYHPPCLRKHPSSAPPTLNHPPLALLPLLDAPTDAHAWFGEHWARRRGRRRRWTEFELAPRPLLPPLPPP